MYCDLLKRHQLHRHRGRLKGVCGDNSSFVFQLIEKQK